MTASAIAVLDIDGTLIDSTYHHALARYRALRPVGEIHPVWRPHRMIGTGGDSVRDVEEAKRAGMPAIVVRSGGFGDDELRKAGAMALYDTPGEPAKALDDTPLA
ncbi:HAD hydrolase-like protein [Streptomyces sp. NPDC056580]|uniref:HAD hydrolase-like protein n=1 Tax=Streptomyces sp. NPDC056580 TaxID=3345872 RepID=UPI0036A7ABF7